MAQAVLSAAIQSLDARSTFNIICFGAFTARCVFFRPSFVLPNLFDIRRERTSSVL